MNNYDAWLYAITSVSGTRMEHAPITYAIALNQPIKSIHADEDKFCMRFEEGTLTVTDNGQSCCEQRYMTTDDELHTFVGEKLVGFDVTDGPDLPDEYRYHEQTFVRLHTTGGTITLVTHNIHNGYYGGFDVTASWQGE